MSPPSCSLCTLVSDPSADPLFLGESEAAVAVLHPDWAVRGHAMVVARPHVENLSRLELDERTDFVNLYARLERALMDIIGVERVVMVKLGLAVPHLHWHLYPVPASRERSEIFAAIDGETRDEPDDAEKRRLIDVMRSALASS